MTSTYRQTTASEYFTNDRADVVAKLPRPLGRVLDVGCGAGGVGRSLRAAGAERLAGVEVHAPAAEEARTVFDTVYTGTIEDAVATDALEGPFDTIVLYDVLEHLVDPGAVLARLDQLAGPRAQVHVSVPNARHWSLLYDLVARGTFGYTEWGHRDRTHLRWFTRRDIAALLEAHGWHVSDVSSSVPGRNATVDRVTGGRLREFLALQWHVLARRG
ncbi:MAG: hypothetical protein QOF29_3237 [bacterium]